MRNEILDYDLNEKEMTISIKIDALIPKFIQCWDYPVRSKSSHNIKKDNKYTLKIIEEEGKIENRKQSSSYQRWAQQEISQHQKFQFAGTSQYIVDEHYKGYQKRQKQKIQIKYKQGHKLGIGVIRNKLLQRTQEIREKQQQQNNTDQQYILRPQVKVTIKFK